jgi:iron complex transport system substrate-binding protein
MDPHRARPSAIILAALVALLAALSCARRSAPGREVPSRVVSLSPSTTETLFAIGAGDRVVGRSRFCDYPPEALRLPVVGGYVDPSLEAIVALKPDLVVGARGPGGAGLAAKLDALGIATFFPPTDSIDDIDAMIEQMGVKTGLAERARQVAASSRRRRDEIARAVAGEPRVRVLLVFGTTPIVVAGPGSFPNEMLALANGENVLTSGLPYTTLGAERLVLLEPEVIVNASMTGANDRSSGIGPDEPAWRELSAVRQGRVVAIHDDSLLRPGPRIGEGVAVLARALHPHASVP